MRDAEENPPRAPYEGNQTDLSALIAGILGAASLLTWLGGGMCLPIGAGVLGLAAISSTVKGLNQASVQQYSIFGVGMGVLSLVPFLILFCFFAFVFGFVLASGSTGP